MEREQEGDGEEGREREGEENGERARERVMCV